MRVLDFLVIDKHPAALVCMAGFLSYFPLKSTIAHLLKVSVIISSFAFDDNKQIPSLKLGRCSICASLIQKNAVSSPFFQFHLAFKWKF